MTSTIASRPTPIVVVTGPPASGKTTIAQLVADTYALPLIAKDAIKERLYDSLGGGDVAWTRRLGDATYPLVYQFLEAQLRAGRSAVVEGTFRADVASREFAQIHRRWPFRALQLFCTAPDDVLLARYAERASTRHPGHNDAAIVPDLRASLANGVWRPLDLAGTLLRVDTTASDEAARLLRAVTAHLEPDDKPQT